MSNATIKEIQDVIVGDQTVDLRRVRSWMESADIEVLGAVHLLLARPEYRRRVRPTPPTEAVASFLLRYYERCLMEDPQGEWALTRYEAAAQVLGWFAGAPEHVTDSSVDLLQRLKELLAQVYRKGNREIRDAVVCGALEHIFEEPRWREFFSDWQDGSALQSALDQAMEWVRHRPP